VSRQNRNKNRHIVCFDTETSIRTVPHSLANTCGVLTNTVRWIKVQRRFRSKPEHIPQGECQMARLGAGNASPLSHGQVSLPVSIAAIAVLFASNVSAHGGGLNVEGCHNDRKHGGYHCHRGSASSSRSDVIPDSDSAPSRVAPVRALRDNDAFMNCAQARAAGAAPVRRGQPGYGSHLDRDGDGVGCEPRRR
jgi:hypothetical protein